MAHKPEKQGLLPSDAFPVSCGSQRYRCKACGKTFAVGKSTTGHKQPHKNKMIFALLVNKSPFRRMSEVAGIGPSGLYGKIDFLDDQCLAFAAARERRLRAGMGMTLSAFIWPLTGRITSSTGRSSRIAAASREWGSPKTTTTSPASKHVSDGCSPPSIEG